MKSTRSRRHQKNLNRRPRQFERREGGDRPFQTARRWRRDRFRRPMADRAEIGIGEETALTVRVKPHPKFKEIYQATLEDGAQRLATRNLTPGLNVYGERLVKFKGVEYRIWDAFRSNLQPPSLKACKMCL